MIKCNVVNYKSIKWHEIWGYVLGEKIHYNIVGSGNAGN